MNCICDEFTFPPETRVSPGLTLLRRQTGTFAEFRRALLRGASIRSTALLEKHPLWSSRYLIEADREGLKKSLEAIGQWRGRHPQDFGIMLIELWAYVCDIVSFYDDVFAHDSYVRTARRRDSLRKLVDPLGYIPRPAVAALVELAVFGDGRSVVSLPPGTGFRSGAFAGNSPQVFELGAETSIHPLLNEWSILPVRPATFGKAGASRHTFLCESGTVSVKEGEFVLVKVGSSSHVATIATVSNMQGADHVSYTAVTLFNSVWIPEGTPVNAVRLLKPTSKTSLWTRSTPAYGWLTSGKFTFSFASWFLLDVISTAFKNGQDIIVENGGALTASEVMSVDTFTVTVQEATVSEVRNGSGTVVARVPLPEITAQTTKITISPPMPGINRVSPGDDAEQISIHHSFVSAARVTIEALTELERSDPLDARTPLEKPRDASTPGTFQLEDVNGAGLTRPGSLDFISGHVTVQGDPWPQSLAAPVRLLGNVVSASRGESVHGEILGAGDATIPNQTLTLKKSPLTYLPAPSESTPSGLSSTLKIYVDGVRWNEVPSFYGLAPEDEIYIVRENDKHETLVTFGDGALGRRLNTGAVVTAYYRFGGGGAAMPPAGSITQVAKPVKGLKGARNPVAAYGGADSEQEGSIRKYAPRSALLLGRAVSLTDLEAAAASYSGVRAVAVEWRWSGVLQLPAAHIWYLADGDLTKLLRNKLRSLTQPDTPIQIERASAEEARLSIQLETDPRRFESDVVASARSALMDVETGLLPPERLGIAKPLFRSPLFDFLLNVPGVTSITGLTLNLDPFSDYGVQPKAGHYFDFTSRLYLNGRNA